MTHTLNKLLCLALIGSLIATGCAHMALADVSGHQQIGNWLFSYNEMHSERNQVLASALGMKR